MLAAIEAVIRGPIFSVQRPLSYQVGDSLIVPQPSTLVNALAYCLSLSKSVTAKGFGDEYLENLVRFVRKHLFRIAVKPLTHIILTPIILSRLRTLEWKSDEVSDKINRGEKLTNVMVREYVFGSYSAIFLFINDEVAKESMKFLHLLNRVGDTESLISVRAVREADIIGEEESSLVDTYTPCDWVENVSGDYLSIRLCEEEYAEHRLERIRGKPSDLARKKLEDFLKFSKNFYLPLKVERTSRNYLLYRPAVFSAKAKNGFTIALFRTLKGETKIVVKKEWLK